MFEVGGGVLGKGQVSNHGGGVESQINVRSKVEIEISPKQSRLSPEL